MRILDENSDESLKDLTLYLTHAEAVELRDSLEKLLRKPLNNHAHIKEIPKTWSLDEQMKNIPEKYM